MYSPRFFMTPVILLPYIWLNHLPIILFVFHIVSQRPGIDVYVEQFNKTNVYLRHGFKSIDRLHWFAIPHSLFKYPPLHLSLSSISLHLGPIHGQAFKAIWTVTSHLIQSSLSKIVLYSRMWFHHSTQHYNIT